MTQLVDLRKQLKPVADARGASLSFLPFIMKAMSLALTQYPMINAHVNADCTEVVYRVCARVFPLQALHGFHRCRLP
jgi:2-oxoisovalerate dehydrogenase E2 component (dihydrolipoyl transacylase)